MIAEEERFAPIRNQLNLFDKNAIIPQKPIPYKFQYKYKTEDGERLGTCQDWETETTYQKWENLYGKEKALDEIKRVFGEEYP